MKMKKGFLSGLLCSVIISFLIPCFVSAEDGTGSVNEIAGILDLSTQENKAEGNGYIWEPDGEGGYILTLDNAHITGEVDPNNNNLTYALKLPNGKKVTVKTIGYSVLDGGILANSTWLGALDLFFDGAVLTINGQISSGTDNDHVTVQGGSSISVRDGFNLGPTFVDSHISVIGPDSILTVDSNTTVSHLEVLKGGKLVTSKVIYIQSVYDPYTNTQNMGSIIMDSSSVIEINSKPALVSTEINDKTDATAPGIDAALQSVLESIQDYLPSGYKIGIGTDTNDGKSYCTILDSNNQIAGPLILQRQDSGNTDNTPETPDNGDGSQGGNNPPNGGDGPQDGDNPPDGGDGSQDGDNPSDGGGSSSDEKDPTIPNKKPNPWKPTGSSGPSSNSHPQSTAVPAGNGPAAAAPSVPENAPQNGTTLKSPQTGEADSAGIWLFYIPGSVMILYLLTGLYKAYKH